MCIMYRLSQLAKLFTVQKNEDRNFSSMLSYDGTPDIQILGGVSNHAYTFHHFQLMNTSTHPFCVISL